jgi:glycosyltransferase involved in cell wall biosynthesis
VKVLFLANRIPFPPFRGDKLKIYNLARRLASDHALYLVTFVQDKEDLKYRKELEKIFEEVHFIYQPQIKSVINCVEALFTGESFQLAYFRNKEMGALLNVLFNIHEFDVCHVQHLRMSQYVTNITCPKILDLPDAYSLYWERRKSVKRKWYNRFFDSMESKRVIEAENVLHQFDLNLVCSVEDRDFLIKKHKTDKIKLLRNGVDLGLFVFRNHNYRKNDTLVFTGNMDYAPNIDAVITFVANMWPTLKKEYPDLKLIIAGQRPVSAVRDLESESIEITGFVSDMSTMYEKATIVICTEIGFAGLEIASGDGCILSLNDQEFIANVGLLLNDAKMREEVGRKGLEIAQNKFSWDGISKQLEVYLEEVAQIY